MSLIHDPGVKGASDSGVPGTAMETGSVGATALLRERS